ncbi:MAG: DUF2804 domain-containing protein [Spirochaetota bacterium]
MQTEVTQEMDLLRDDGRITREGYARQPVWRYRRDRVRAPWWRIKEWDYYAVIDQASGAGVTITFSDLGYAGLMALCFVDVKHGLVRQVDSLKPLTRGKLGLAEAADADHVLEYADKTLRVRLERNGGERRLSFSDAGATEGRTGARLEGEIVLHQPSDQERLAIATSWAKKRTAFYYNQKINCMPAEGWMRAEGDKYRFAPETSFGVLDWGRGHWTYRNRWYWASASGLVDGVPFGFNFGYGFTDRSPASENMLFYGGQEGFRAHKLEEVRFEFDAENYLKPWAVHSNDGRVELVFEPTVNRAGRFNLLLIESDQKQVFGYYRGRVVLDDGRELKVENLAGFAEDVFNRW